jgi:glycerophosphoryl diester phosphodiesterase
MLVLAHRGAHGSAAPGLRENTVPAFRAATAIGADGVEFDVRRTADGALVVHHDPTLPDGRRIEDVAHADAPAWVPSLAEALDACAGMTLVDVEIKNSPFEPGFDPTHEIGRQVAEALAGRTGILVSSFNLATLDAFREVDPATPTGWLTLPGYDQLDAATTTAAHGHSALNPPDAATTPEVVGAAKACGLLVVTWTVNDGGRLAELAALGVDVAISDRPDRAAGSR